MSEHGSFSIRVVDKNGRGVRGAKVSYQCGRLSGIGSGYTDSDGWAAFNIVSEVFFGGGAIPIYKIWVNSVEVSSRVVYPKDGDTFSFKLP